MSEFDLADLLATLETCREYLPLPLVPEHDARLEQISALLSIIYAHDISAAQQERSLFDAPDDLFDAVTTFRTEQWAIRERPAFVTRPQPHDEVDALGAYDDDPSDDTPDDLDEDSDNADEPVENEPSNESKLVDALNYWHNPYTKLQEQTWRERWNRINRAAQAILEQVPQHPHAGAARQEFSEQRAYVLPPERRVDPATDPFSLPLDVYDPEHLIALTTWLFHPRTRHTLALDAWRYRRHVRHLRQLVDELPANHTSDASTQAKALLASLCTNCGHPGVLAPKHFQLCGHCSYVHPIGGTYSIFPLKSQAITPMEAPTVA